MLHEVVVFRKTERNRKKGYANKGAGLKAMGGTIDVITKRAFLTYVSGSARKQTTLGMMDGKGERKGQHQVRAGRAWKRGKESQPTDPEKIPGTPVKRMDRAGKEVERSL